MTSKLQNLDSNFFLTRERKARMGEGKQEGEKEENCIDYVLWGNLQMRQILSPFYR